MRTAAKGGDAATWEVRTNDNHRQGVLGQKAGQRGPKEDIPDRRQHVVGGGAWEAVGGEQVSASGKLRPL